MSEFMDGNGDFVGFGNLGPGAGSVRSRNQDGDEVNGTENAKETKWQRTE
jgi:hypothetical protein